MNATLRQGALDVHNELRNEMPKECNTSIICPIHTKDERKDCSNYRGKSLLNIAYKIFASIMYEYLKPHVICIIGLIPIPFQKTYEYNIDTHHFIEFRQTHDTPTRD
uniref:Uncharacterized protein n=1 Tax=Megaselia scalaris TaxID=36166 RepID=T1GRM5_MEGSC